MINADKAKQNYEKTIAKIQKEINNIDNTIKDISYYEKSTKFNISCDEFNSCEMDKIKEILQKEKYKVSYNVHEINEDRDEWILYVRWA